MAFLKHYYYTLVPHPDGTISKVPLIPIILMGKNLIKTYGVVDSGSDSCAISLRLAELLGLPLTGRRDQSRGIGGVVESVSADVTIILQGNGQEKHTFPFNIVLTKHNFPVILGQDGFFDKFIITFHRAEEYFTLKHRGRRFWPL